MARYPIRHAKAPCAVCGYTERLRGNGRCWTCEWNKADQYMRHFFANRSKMGPREGWSREQCKLHDHSVDVWLWFADDQRERNRFRDIRHRRRASEGRYTKAQTDAILASQGHHCAYCEKSKNLHLDHIIPLARGGTNWPWNLQWLCAFHNTSKGASTDAEYRDHIGLPVAEMLKHPFKRQLWINAFALAA